MLPADDYRRACCPPAIAGVSRAAATEPAGAERLYRAAPLWAVVLLLGCAAADGDGGAPLPLPGCQGLACQVPQCPTNQPTVVRGRVTAPNGRDPIDQAIVYVPESGQLTPLPTGLGCELCRDPFAGRAVTFAHSDLDGRFELRDPPAGATIPLVVQKGRFRRLFQVPIAPCQSQTVAIDGGQLALPRSRSEGELPQMAVAAGDHDAIECVLRDLGIDPSEFAAADGPAAVHLYDNQTPGMPTLPGQLALPALLSDRARLLRYHLVFLNCSGTVYSQTLLKDPAILHNLRDYVAAGGRLYATDWSYDFLQQVPELAPFLCFDDGQDCAITTPHTFHSAVAQGGDGDPLQASVDQSTAGGRALAAWLAQLPSPVDANNVQITDLLPGWVMLKQTAVDPSRFPATVWLNTVAKGQPRPLTVTFDYPPQAVCGRVLFSSAHTRERLSQKLFPSYCPLGGGALVQEQILEFLLFNLSGCVGTIG